MTKITSARFKELLERARKIKAANEAAALLELQTQMQSNNVDIVDLSKTGITQQMLDSKEPHVQETVTEVVTDLALNANATANASKVAPLTGVAADVTLNAQQQQFLDLVLTRQDAIMIGAAGTGKTTTMRKVTRALLDSGEIPKIREGTKWLRLNSPGAIILSFTNKAVANIRRAVVDELKANTLTVHKLLEFEPEYYTVADEETGKTRTTMEFIPKRNQGHPLPDDIVFVAFEESSMLGTELYNLYVAAMPHKHQEVFLGDLQQLPPTFGTAILGYKLLELPTVELTEIYRQAKNSPIISLAWDVLEGKYKEFSSKLIPDPKNAARKICPALVAKSGEGFDPETGESLGVVKFQIWQKKLTSEHGLLTACKQITTWIDDGYFDYEEDIILCPYNKAFGTIELNKAIAQHVGVKNQQIVHEVIAGYNKHYLAIGDRVLYEKEDARIVNIERNPKYIGQHPMTASVQLDRWGHYRKTLTDEEVAQDIKENQEADNEAIELLLNSGFGDTEDERSNAASHIVTVQIAGYEYSHKLSSAGDINNLLGGYAITVHKAQGSEYRRVFVILHHTHSKMISRELLYTLITRARHTLHIICEPENFERGIRSQRITGNSIKEKAEYFKGILEDKSRQVIVAKTNPLVRS